MLTNAYIIKSYNEARANPEKSRASGLSNIVARGYGVGRRIGLFGHPKRKILVMGFQGIFNKLKAPLIRVGLELSSWDSIIYFVVKRPYDSILTLSLRKVNKNTRILKNIFQCLIYFVHSIIGKYNTIQN